MKLVFWLYLLAAVLCYAETPPPVYIFTSPITLTGRTVAMPQSDATHNGYLSSTDWSIFKNTLPSQTGQVGNFLATNGTIPLWVNGSPTAGSTWGTLVGTLTNQTDLVTALNMKMFFRGEWIDSATQYFPNDVVTYQGNTFVSLLEQHGATPAPSIYWAALSSALTFPILAPEGGIGTGYGFVESGSDTGMYSLSDGNLSFSSNGSLAFEANGTTVHTRGDLNVDGNIAAANFPPTGPSDTFAGYNDAGVLTNIQNWNFNNVNFGLQLNLTADFTDGENWYSLRRDVALPADTTNFLNVVEIDSNIDTAATGHKLGDNSSGGINLINTGLNRTDSAGEIGSVGIVNGFSNMGDGTNPMIIDHWQTFGHGENFNPGTTVRDYRGIGIFPHFFAGSTLEGSNILQMNPQYDGTTTGFIEPIAIFPNFGAASTTAHLHVFESGGDANTTGFIDDYLGINMYLNNAHVGSMTGIQFTPQNITLDNGVQLGNFQIGNSSIGNYSTLVQIGGGNNTIASGKNVTGLHIDVAGFVGDQQNTSLTAEGGAINLFSPYDTASLTPVGEFQLSLIGGTFNIAPGHPITNGSFGFGNNMGPTVIIGDDMGPDMTGVGIGFSVDGLVNQIAVADGKTADTINYMLVGGGATNYPGATLGTGVITNANLVNAIGFLPEGAPLFGITNMVAFKSGQLLCLLAANCWGVKIDNATADNWFAKDVIIGGATGKPTQSGNALDVTGPAQFSDVIQLPVQAAATTPACVGVSDDGKIAITNTHILCVCNGNTPGWFQSSDGITACTF